MSKMGGEGTAANQWTLIRGIRQLLTLHGPGGPRRGAAMANLALIPDASILIRDGLIEEVGSARRIENLAAARLAREIDAGGRVVMPAFVDSDMALAAPPPRSREPDIRRMSARRLYAGATDVASELARYGVLTAGAHTGFAPDFQSTTKALRVHLALQSRPLRIRSVFSPPLDSSIALRIAGIAHRRLASLIEIPAVHIHSGPARSAAINGAAENFTIRFRALGPATPEVLELALAAGAAALIGAIPEDSALSRAVFDTGCIPVELGTRMLADQCRRARDAVDAGAPVALASGYRPDVPASLNPQFLIFQACRILAMTVEEAIVAVTYNAACSLRLSHVTGSIEPGKSADLCVMDMDDYRELARRAGHHDVWLVTRAGQVIHRRPPPVLD